MSTFPTHPTPCAFGSFLLDLDPEPALALALAPKLVILELVESSDCIVRR
jgi:hypothetical protein